MQDIKVLYDAGPREKFGTPYLFEPELSCSPHVSLLNGYDKAQGSSISYLSSVNVNHCQVYL